MPPINLCKGIYWKFAWRLFDGGTGHKAWTLRYGCGMLCSNANVLGWSASELLTSQWPTVYVSSWTTELRCVFCAMIGQHAVLISASERSEVLQDVQSIITWELQLRTPAPPLAAGCLASSNADVRFAETSPKKSPLGHGSGVPAELSPHIMLLEKRSSCELPLSRSNALSLIGRRRKFAALAELDEMRSDVR